MKANIGQMFVAPVKDEKDRLIEEEIDEELYEKMRQAKLKDEGYDRMQIELRKKFNQTNHSERINSINKQHRGLLIMGFVAVAISGIIQPVFGILFSELIYYSTENAAIFGVDYIETVPGEENLLCLYVVIIAIALGVCIAMRFYAFGKLAQNITSVMR